MPTVGSKKDEYSDFGKSIQPTIKGLLGKFESELAQINNFWERATKANLLLTRLLAGAKATTARQVTEAYLDLWAWAGNSNNRNKEIEHLDLLLFSLELVSGATAKNMAKEIGQIKEKLETAMGS